MTRAQRRGRGAGRSLVLVLFWSVVVAAVVTAFGVVVWRQTRAVALEECLREAESEHAIAEAERVELERRIQELGARARITRIARRRLGMHLPEADEIIFLPAAAGTENLPDSLGVRQ